MDPTNENPAAPGAATGSGNIELRGSDRSPENSPDQSTKQEKIAALQREFIAEALRIVAFKASHAADDIEIGDDACAERSIRIAILNLREAATGFRQLEALEAARAGLAGSP